MDRKTFLKALATLPLTGAAMKLQGLHKITDSFQPTDLMPVLFLGHGNPMNAIVENEFATNFQQLGQKLAKPTAILCISAHWETKGTLVTAMQNPRTIHDFGGFPQALFDVQYAAPGAPELAKETQQLVDKTAIGLDHEWGLDHGAWSVLKHLYPDADIPVIQMSLDYTKPPQFHYDLAKQLAALRKKGVLIVGSGNIVHNLRRAARSKEKGENYGYDWAIEANEKMKSYISKNDHNSLINYHKQGQAFQLAIPTPDHYLPLLYTLALQGGKEEVQVFNDKMVAGSLGMASFTIGI